MSLFHRMSALAALCLFSACASTAVERLPGAAQLLPSGSVVKMSNENGSIKIEAVDETTRRYTWNGNTLTAKLAWRTYKESGATGLHSHEGTPLLGENPKLITNESTVEFTSLTEARRWTDESCGLEWVSNRDGWLIGYGGSDFHPRYIRIEIFRAYINGKPAQVLPERKGTSIDIRKMAEKGERKRGGKEKHH